MMAKQSFNAEFTQQWRKANVKQDKKEPVEQSAPVKKTRKKKGADK